MNGQKTKSKRQIVEEYIKRVNPYEKQRPLEFDLRKYAAYVKEKGLAGITLSTNKYAPAPLFYRSNGFTDCEHVLFMAKQV